VSNGFHHWTVMTALALLVPPLMLLAAARTPGWRIPALSGSIAAGAWAISCLLADFSGGKRRPRLGMGDTRMGSRRLGGGRAAAEPATSLSP
jgi:hypothetical protein